MKTVLNVKIDKPLKKAAQKVATRMGLPLSALVTAQLRHVVREQEVYFATPERVSKKLARELRMIDADIKAGRNLSPVFHSAKEMDAYLDSL